MWRIQRALLDGLSFATIGPISLEQWLSHALLLRRHFFNAPRRRSMQQARVFAADAPLMANSLS